MATDRAGSGRAIRGMGIASLAKGWSRELRDQIRDQCREIVNRDAWRSKIAIGLKSEHPMIFDEADVAAA